MRVAVVFPGQGSQYAGMADPWLSHHVGSEVIGRASELLGYDVAVACGDPDRLADTAILQPVLLACDLAAHRVLEAEGQSFSMAAGHSLGEFAALVAAGALSFEDALRTVAERGAAMGEAAALRPGAMSAIVGPPAEEVAEICRVAGRGDVLTVANENSPVQTVVSGTVAAVERAEELARSRGARVMRLAVAGAFHSPLMRPAMERVRRAIADLEFHTPGMHVVPNASGRPTDRPAALRDLLARHVSSPVKWATSIRAMAAAGVDVFIEAGPGDVLTRLVRRCAPGSRAVAVGSPDEAAALAADLRAGVA